MKRKLFSILLSLAMVVTMMPLATMTAFANPLANPLPSTISIDEILGTVDFPTSSVAVPPDNAWVNEDGSVKCYFFNGTHLAFQKNPSNPIDMSILKNETIPLDGQDYKYSCYNSDFRTQYTVTFCMNNNRELASIQVKDYSDSTLNGTYTPPIIKVTVTFNMNDHGTAIDPITVDKGSTIEAPATPAEEGWNFAGWYTDEECTDGNEYDFSTPVTADMTLHAKWVEKSKPTPAPTPDPKSDDTNKGVKTGDSSDIIFYGFATLLALLGAGFVYGLRRKEEK